MVIQALIFLFLFLCLFFSGNKTSQTIYYTVLLVTKNKKAALYTLLAILLPGTIIHELSHFVIATICFVPVGKISILPEVEEGRVKAGSVHHANTDIFRRTAIGLAPILIGLLLIYLLGYTLVSLLSSQVDVLHQITIVLIFYLLFVISLSMFSSKKDLETTWFLIPLIAICGIALYFAGIRIGFTPTLMSSIESLLKQLNLYIALTIIIDIIVFSILKGIMHISEKVFKRRIVTT